MKISLRKPKAPPSDAAAKPTQKKVKVRAMTASTRFVLVIGEEGAILIHLQKGKVLGRYFTSDLQPDNIQTIHTVLNDNRDVPVYVLVDTHDQFYVQQTLPPISPISLGKMIKRRIHREFPNHQLKGSIILGKAEGEGRRDWNFLIVALEETPLMQSWLQWILAQPNRCLGVHLLPVETTSLIQYMHYGLDPENHDNDWLFLVTHNKVSGFRQVILHNGKIVFTRLGQPLGEENAEVAAGLVEQEIQSTIEYLKRLGLKDTKTVSMYIICADDIKRTIDTNRFGGAHVATFTPHELAERMKLEGATQESDRYGDVVVGSYVSCQRKAELPLFTVLMKKIQQLYQMVIAERVVAGLAALGVVYMIGSAAYDVFFLQSEVTKFNNQKNIKQQDLDKLKKESSETKDDIEKIADFVSVYDAYELEAYSPLPTFYRLSQVLDNTVRAKSLSWDVVPPTKGAGAGAAAATAGGKIPQTGRMSLLFLDFPATNDAAQKYTQELLEKLKAKLGPDYQIKYDTLRGVVKETDKFDVNIGKTEENKDPKKAEKPGAEVFFTGPVIMKGEDPKPPVAASPGTPTPPPPAAPGGQ